MAQITPRPNIHLEHYLLAVGAKDKLNLSTAEVSLLRDIYLDSLPVDQQHTDMWTRMSYIKEAVKQARAIRGVDVKV
jgi:hypothetical protein